MKYSVLIDGRRYPVLASRTYNDGGDPREVLTVEVMPRNGTRLPQYRRAEISANGIITWEKDKP